RIAASTFCLAIALGLCHVSSNSALNSLELAILTGKDFLFQLCSEPPALFNSMELESASVAGPHRNTTRLIFLKAKTLKSFFCDSRKGRRRARLTRGKSVMCPPPIVPRWLQHDRCCQCVKITLFCVT